jgi:hypothetical protein
MMDAETVIQKAKAGTAPADWQTLPAKSSFFVWSAIGGIVFTFFAVLAAGYLFLTGSFVGIGVNDQTPDNVAFFWFIVDMVVLALCAIGGIVYAIIRARDLGSVNEQALIMTPDGFVKRTCVGPKATVSASYANIARLTPAVRNSTQYLDMVTRDGRKVRVELDGRFGNVKKLARQIAGQHAHYVATHSGGQQ